MRTFLFLICLCVLASCRHTTVVPVTPTAIDPRDSIAGKYTGLVRSYGWTTLSDSVQGPYVINWDNSYQGYIEIRALGKDSITRSAPFLYGRDTLIGLKYDTGKVIFGYGQPSKGGEEFRIHSNHDSLYYWKMHISYGGYASQTYEFRGKK